MKLKVMFLFACLFLSIGIAIAQSSNATGRVLSAEDNEPIVGATVQIEGTDTGTITDLDGKFTINVPSSAQILVISFIGMETQKINIKEKNRTDLTIKLKPTAEVLDEVLVTGTYGSAKKLGSIVGSVVAIRSDKIENRPSANFADALQGQVAGLQVYTSSGEPSEGVSMRLRGIGSISSSNEPLFILDGSPISGGAFTAINPSDIENVTVLKDASSTSIYGSRAANGVVVITTKRGRGAKPTVSIKGQYGFSEPALPTTRMMTTSQYYDLWKTISPNADFSIIRKQRHLSGRPLRKCHR